MNPQIFEPHILQVACPLLIRDYCVVMNNLGVWGTEIEILGVATSYATGPCIHFFQNRKGTNVNTTEMGEISTPSTSYESGF